MTIDGKVNMGISRPPRRIVDENNSVSVVIMDESNNIGINLSTNNLSRGSIDTFIPLFIKSDCIDLLRNKNHQNSDLFLFVFIEKG